MIINKITEAITKALRFFTIPSIMPTIAAMASVIPKTIHCNSLMRTGTAFRSNLLINASILRFYHSVIGVIKIVYP